LLKIKALAEGTSFEFERKSALEHLHRLMEKHGVSEQDLNNEAVSTHEFKYSSKRERQLLTQVIYKVFVEKKWTQYGYRRNGRKVSNIFGVDCTTAQKIEIDFLFGFYKELYRKEEKIFFNAFINKHKLFGVSCESDDSDNESDENEIRKMMSMMNGMDNATPHKLIEANKTDEDDE
jgi:hypothetical protein